MWAEIPMFRTLRRFSMLQSGLSLVGGSPLACRNRSLASTGKADPAESWRVEGLAVDHLGGSTPERTTARLRQGGVGHVMRSREVPCGEARYHKRYPRDG